MMDVLDYMIREARISRMNITSLTLVAALGFGVLFFQEVRIRNIEERIRRTKKGRI